MRSICAPRRDALSAMAAMSAEHPRCATMCGAKRSRVAICHAAYTMPQMVRQRAHVAVENPAVCENGEPFACRAAVPQARSERSARRSHAWRAVRSVVCAEEAAEAAARCEVAPSAYAAARCAAGAQKDMRPARGAFRGAPLAAAVDEARMPATLRNSPFCRLQIRRRTRSG